MEAQSKGRFRWTLRMPVNSAQVVPRTGPPQVAQAFT